MSYDDYDYDEPVEEERPRDPAVDRAKVALTEFFRGRRATTDVFYNTQLAVLFEREFFHWITKRAVNELVAEGVLESRTESRSGGGEIRFYWAPANRYGKRKRKRIHDLVDTISDPKLGLGDHGENMVDAALGRVGFKEIAQNVAEHEGKGWEVSGKDLDRIYERDGVKYGAEIKNTLGYIDREEFDEKLGMCLHFGVVPLFVMRAAAKSYAYKVINAGGFCLLFGKQLYPFGHDELVAALQEELLLPVHSPKRLESGHVERFLRWHIKTAGL